jgi:hypothetical protein
LIELPENVTQRRKSADRFVGESSAFLGQSCEKCRTVFLSWFLGGPVIDYLRLVVTRSYYSLKPQEAKLDVGSMYLNHEKSIIQEVT